MSSEKISEICLFGFVHIEFAVSILIESDGKFCTVSKYKYLLDSVVCTKLISVARSGQALAWDDVATICYDSDLREEITSTKGGQHHPGLTHQ